MPHHHLLFILFLYRLFFGLLMGIYSNILSRGHVLVVILAWCSSRFVWVWKILEYLGIPSVGFIGPSLRLEGISAAVIKGMMLVAILLKTCFSRLIPEFYQAYTRFSKSRGGLLRGRKAPAVPRGEGCLWWLLGGRENPLVPRGKRLFRGANYIHPRGECHGLPGIYGREWEIFRMKWQKFLFSAGFSGCGIPVRFW